MATDDAALGRLRDDLLAAIRELEMRFDARAGELETRFDVRAGELETRLDARFSALEARLDATSGELETRLGALEARLDTTSGELETRLGARIDASAAETRRHMGVVAEDLRSKLALVAEGVVTLTERLAIQIREGSDVIDRRLLRLEARLPSTPEHG